MGLYSKKDKNGFLRILSLLFLVLAGSIGVIIVTGKSPIFTLPKAFDNNRSEENCVNRGQNCNPFDEKRNKCCGKMACLQFPSGDSRCTDPVPTMTPAPCTKEWGQCKKSDYQPCCYGLVCTEFTESVQCAKPTQKPCLREGTSCYFDRNGCCRGDGLSCLFDGDGYHCEKAPASTSTPTPVPTRTPTPRPTPTRTPSPTSTPGKV